jgi:hypothetical protein
MSWEDIEDAMHAAVVKASGFSEDQVAWSYQNVNEPTLPHIIITFGGEIVIGIDRVSATTDLSRANEQEVKLEVRGVREVPFEIECFTPETSGSAAARRVAELIRSRMRLTDIRYPLRNVGLCPFDSSQVGWIPDIPSAKFRGRATCTLRCYVPVTDCIEYVGYIARVKGTVTVLGLSGTYGYSGINFDTG